MPPTKRTSARNNTPLSRLIVESEWPADPLRSDAEELQSEVLTLRLLAAALSDGAALRRAVEWH
jgi:hypothetical protein